MSNAMPVWDLRLSSAPEVLCLGKAVHEQSLGPLAVRGHRLHFCKSEATLALGDTELEVTPGSVCLVPPDVTHEYRHRGRVEHLFAHFKVRGESGDSVPVAAVQDLGSDFTGLCERFEHALHVHPSRPAQAEARLWDVLWELAERTLRKEQRQSRRHVALDRACRVIQARLSDPLSLADLATPAGVSPAHLTRLFRAELGLTATDYVRRCRLERALHLLTRSDVPIKEVACEVGIPDLHAFNKAIRRGYGLSPRDLRARGSAPAPLTLRTPPPAAVGRAAVTSQSA